MYAFSRRHVTLLYIFMTLVALISVIVNGSKFVEYETDFHRNLNLFELHSSVCRSQATCGAICEMKKCASFLYEDLTKQCTVFSVFMTYDNTDSDDDYDVKGKYYVRSDALEFINEANTCSTVSLSSPGTNVALRKSVALSSLYHSKMQGELIVDGSRNGLSTKSNPKCAHTLKEINPYAIVDLSETYQINALYIVNRHDRCCKSRLHDVVIQIGDDVEALTTVFNHSARIGLKCTVVFDTAHVGRYVKLLIEATEFLNICELEVYTTK